MSYRSVSRRGGILRVLLILLALAVLAALGVWLIYTRGARMQDQLHEKGDQLRGKILSEGDSEPAPPAAGTADSGGSNSAARPGSGTATPKFPKTKSPYTVAKPPPVAKTTHLVVKEDTFFRIAETYYEDGSLWPIIAQANGLKGPADLKEGMVLVIPGK